MNMFTSCSNQGLRRCRRILYQLSYQGRLLLQLLGGVWCSQGRGALRLRSREPCRAAAGDLEVEVCVCVCM
ncbi:hypothetical protein CapIbe_016549 [Capra ibex]